MLRNILILTVFFHSALFSQSHKSDTLMLWRKERKLTWEDFKGKPKENPINELANIAVKLLASFKKWDGDIPKFEIKCLINKYNSWTIVDDINSLNHEQGHFDIHEIYARKIRKSYDSLYKLKEADVTIYQKVFNTKLSECNRVNYEYEYSNFDLNEQNKWYIKIDKELKVLKNYKYHPDCASIPDGSDNK